MTRRDIGRIGLLLLLPAAGLAAMAAGLGGHLSWAGVASRRAQVLAQVAAAPEWSVVAYVSLYVTASVLCLPTGAVLTALAGLVFGAWWGGLLATVGATLGAAASFLAARFVLGRATRARIAALAPVAAIAPRLRAEGMFYLIALRLVPMLPFWLINVAPALIGFRFGPYLLGSFIGIAPTSVVFAAAGAATGDVIARGDAPAASLLLTPSVILPLLALSMMALLPIGIRRLAARRLAARSTEASCPIARTVPDSRHGTRG